MASGIVPHSSFKKRPPVFSDGRRNVGTARRAAGLLIVLLSMLLAGPPETGFPCPASASGLHDAGSTGNERGGDMPGRGRSCNPGEAFRVRPATLPAVWLPGFDPGRGGLLYAQRSRIRGSRLPVYDVAVVREFPHDPGAFTQGLTFSHRYLYESTGLTGKSSLRRVELETGRVDKFKPLPGIVFGEGLTAWADKLIVLTWRTGVGFVFDRESFEQEGEFTYPTEGWGITHDGRELIMSDGSARLYFLDPETFSETRRIEVRDDTGAVTRLNELEFIKGEIFANIWCEDVIARISPDTGQVRGWIDLRGLRDRLGHSHSAEVLNGIAYDAQGDRILVTGKLWPKLFEIRIVARSGRSGTDCRVARRQADRGECGARPEREASRARPMRERRKGIPVLQNAFRGERR